MRLLLSADVGMDPDIRGGCPATRARVLKALEQVDLDRRAVLILHDIEGEKVPDIAEALGILLNTAYSRLRVARERFAAAFRAARKERTMADLPELPPDTARAFDHERGRSSFDPNQEAQLLSRLDAGMVASAVGTASMVAGAKWAGVFLAGAVAGGLVGVGVYARFAPPQIVEVRVETPAPAAPIPLQLLPPPPVVVPKKKRAESRADGVGEERALVDMARTAVARGKYVQALEALFQHVELYPEGSLTEEREVLLVQALLSSGMRRQAEARVRRFKELYPASLFLRTLETLLQANDGFVPKPESPGQEEQ